MLAHKHKNQQLPKSDIAAKSLSYDYSCIHCVQLYVYTQHSTIVKCKDIVGASLSDQRQQETLNSEVSQARTAEDHSTQTYACIGSEHLASRWK